MSDVPQPSVQVEYKRGDNKPKLVLKFKGFKSSGLAQKLEKKSSRVLPYSDSKTDDCRIQSSRPFSSVHLSPLPDLLSPFREELPEGVNWDFFNYLHANSLSSDSSSDESEAEDAEYLDFEEKNKQQSQFEQELYDWKDRHLRQNGVIPSTSQLERLHIDTRVLLCEHAKNRSQVNGIRNTGTLVDNVPQQGTAAQDVQGCKGDVRSRPEVDHSRHIAADGFHIGNWPRDNAGIFAAATQNESSLPANANAIGPDDQLLLKRSNSDRHRRPVKYKSINELTVSSPTMHSSPGSNQDSTAKVVLPVPKQAQGQPQSVRRQNSGSMTERQSVRDVQEPAQLAKASARPSSSSAVPERLEGPGNRMFTRDGQQHQPKPARDVEPCKPPASARPAKPLRPAPSHDEPRKASSKHDKQLHSKPSHVKHLEPKPQIQKHRPSPPPQWSPDNMFDKRQSSQHTNALRAATPTGNHKATKPQQANSSHSHKEGAHAHPHGTAKAKEAFCPSGHGKHKEHMHAQANQKSRDAALPRSTNKPKELPKPVLKPKPPTSLPDSRSHAPAKPTDIRAPPAEHRPVGTKRPAVDTLDHRPAKQLAKSDKFAARGPSPPVGSKPAEARSKPAEARSKPAEARPKPKAHRPSTDDSGMFNERPKASTHQKGGAPDRPKAAEHSVKPAHKTGDRPPQHSVVANGTRNLPPAEPAPVPVHSQSRLPPSTIVWAKLGQYPWWPAQVQEPAVEKHLRLPHSKMDYFVVFYGDNNYSWLSPSCVQEFKQDYGRRVRPKGKDLQRAINEAWQAIGRPRPPDNYLT